MSRDVKFRAWDNVDMKMYYTGEEDNIHFYFDGCRIVAERFYNEEVCTPEGERDFYGDSEKLEHLKYLEYTGLKDKNSAEIYEGDVIFVPAWNREYKIVFEAGMYRARNLSHGWSENKVSLATFKGGINCEVIGNIYEHPHLLEVAQ